ncbi:MULTISPECIES: hypothetical protein [Bradyrhizobium]|jgi:hypothetical protein|uniref:hypothetical protein n=1 Tax=Bradyrhizobium TaxID=374 RepID=UPI0004B1636B|nr:hypothetical protein [Bradyrhizobium elkanii]MCS3559402.1 hypothetical protein [Bradyrhizobium elkanii]MCW2150752.1 hypothetical protein [Bradyrhizobium elkanii]MCW2359178.1 hypothetical protein [Bradyrhizobium elkanii]MCW2374483.1 hypothetical protein [Bradyrhizobium elkanii]
MLARLREMPLRSALRGAASTLRATLAAIWDRWKAYERIEARGLALLSAWLSPEQRAQFEKHNRFDVIGSESGKRYRICYGTSTNVYEMDGGDRIVLGWCFRPVGSLVAGDVMLAQKIALETDERATLMVAKPFPSSMPPRANLPPVS